MAHWNEGIVVDHRQWNDRLHSLYIAADIEPFQAGQFARIGLRINNEEVGRPYSLVNAPDQRPLEIYYILVPGGPLTSHLVDLKPGDRVLVGPRANGFMILDEVPAGRHLWLMATGTGVGPFLSILSTAAPWRRFERVVLVYAVRTLSELSYQQRIHDLQLQHGSQFVFIPVISREQVEFALPGRIPQRIADGSLEARADIRFSAEDSQVLLCGNPQMVEDTTQILLARGLKKHRRRDPGQITVENYW